MTQVGTDRILEIQFSDGQYKLFLEFYAGGNIILTDADFSILALLRSVPEAPGQEELRVGLKYSLHSRQNYHGIPPLTRDRLKDALCKAIETRDVGATSNHKKSKQKPGDALRKAIATSLTEFPPLLIDHALCVVEFDTNVQLDAVIKNDSTLDKVLLAMEEARRVTKSITLSQRCKGYIITKPASNASLKSPPTGCALQAGEPGNLIYDDFHPFRPKQFDDDPEVTIIELDGFNKTVDEFFSSVESQKLDSRLIEREEHARRKLETAKVDHEKRLGGLQQVQQLNVRKAQAIEANVERVHEAVTAVNSLLSQGMDWQNIAQLIEVESKRHNAVAQTIKLPLKLYENVITLLLAEESLDAEADFEGNETGSDVSDSDEQGRDVANSAQKPTDLDKRLAVDVDLALSPWSNARQYYDEKKSAAVKEQKTLQSSKKALKSTEKKINADLKKGLSQEKEAMRPQRRAYWFEKFLYFISSEGYLVLSGRDAQQNEILYKRYLKKGDVYIHADLQGAAPVVVKNKPGKAQDPLPPSTLSQAGILAVATSSAWDSKAVMSAWWVNADQVSKTAPNGDYLQTGMFEIKGQKNFLPPAQLLLGFGMMFKISEKSKARHIKHRVPETATEQIGGDVADVEGITEYSDLAEEADEALVDVQDDDSDHELAESRDRDVNVSKLDQQEIFAPHDNDDENQADSERANPLLPFQRQKDIIAMHSQEGPEADDDVEEDAQGNLNAETANEEVGDGGMAYKGNKQGIRHLSAKERRLMKQGDPANSSQLSQHATSGTDSEGATNSSTPVVSNISKTLKDSQQLRHVRGKHGKRNKIMAKYADQDEEDRVLAMRLLGSTAAQERAKDVASEQEAKEQELAAQRERRRRQHALAAEKGRESETRRRMEFEEGVGSLVEEEAESLEDLDSFVGAPLAGDDILEAIFVCGPWDAIGSRCRWRVKIQPGTTKKGKAVREVLAKWNHTITEGEKKKRPGSGEGNETMLEEDKIRKREGELIRAIRESEVVGFVPVGKVSVVRGAGEKGEKARGGGGGKGKRGGKGSKKQR